MAGSTSTWPPTPSSRACRASGRRSRRIIEARPYRSVDELEGVEDIGRKWLGEIRARVTVE
jgi:hypothetical protein